MYKFAIQMYKYTNEKQERTIDGDPPAHCKPEHIKSGRVNEVTREAGF